MTLRIDINTSGVVKAEKVIDRSFDQMDAAVKSLDRILKALEAQFEKTATATSKPKAALSDLSKAQNRAITESSKLANKLNDLNHAEMSVAKGITLLNKGVIDSTTFTNRYSKAINLLKSEIKGSFGNNLKYESSINKINTALNRQKAIQSSVKNYFASSTRALKSQTAETLKAERALEKYNKELNKTAVVSDKASKSTTALSGFFKTVRAAAVGYATVLATMKIAEFTSNTITAGIALDSLERSFKAITGSSAGAAEELKFVNDIANDLGLDLLTLEKSYKDILAASKNTTLEGQGVRDVFLAISKASAVLGMTTDDTQGSLRALSQMISKGNVQAEELRGQLGERLPGAFQMAAEAMGVTTEKLNDMLENGEVLASELLPRLANVLEDRFGEAAKTAGDRAQGAIVKLKNAVLELQRAVGESGLVEDLADLAIKTTKWVQANEKLLSQDLAAVFKVITVSGGVALVTIGAIADKFNQVVKLGSPLANFIGSPIVGSMDAIVIAEQKLISTEKELASITQRGITMDYLKAKNLRDSIRLQKVLLKNLKDEKRAREELAISMKAAVPGTYDIDFGDISSPYIKKETVEQREKEIAKFIESNLSKFSKASGRYERADYFQRLTPSDADKKSLKIFEQIEKDAQKATKAIEKTKKASKEIRDILSKELDWIDDFTVEDEIKRREKEIAKFIEDNLSKAPGFSTGTEDSWQRIKQDRGPIEVAIEMREAQDSLRESLNGLLDDIEGGSKTAFNEYVDGLNKSLNATTLLSNATISAFKAMEDSLTNYILTGEIGFEDLARTAVAAITRIFVQSQIIKPLANMAEGFNWGSLAKSLGGFLGFANGGVANGLSSASGTIISKPTLFPGAQAVGFATGGVAVGEAGRSEVVLPLERVGKDLGVKANIDGGTPTININVKNTVSDKVNANVTSDTDSFGNTVIGIMIDAANRNVNGFGNVIQGVANRR